MSLDDMRSAMVEQLSSALGGTINVKAHGGRFNLSELRRLAVKGPSALVACLGVTKVTRPATGGIDVTAAWGAFVVCGDKPGLSRDAAALVLVSSLLPLVTGNLWGRDDVHDPAGVRADNLYSSQLDQQAVALWAVTWQQEITLDLIDPSTLDDFLKAHVDYDVNPHGTVDATDDILMPR